MKIDLTSKSLTVQIDIKSLNNRQAIKFKDLIKSDITAALNYIETFKGKRHRHLEVKDATRVDGTDDLSVKRPESILKRFNSLFKYDGASCVPVDGESDYIGVEIECLIPREGGGGPTGEYHDCDCDGDHDENRDNCMSNIEIENDSESESEYDVLQRCMSVLREFRVRDVRVKDDGSLTDNSSVCGVEFVCLTRVSNLDNLNKLCLSLKKLGAKIDSSCGLHVHLDCRQGDGQAVARRLRKALPLLNLMVPKSRIDNRYCSADISTRGERYAKINRESLKKYKTIEIRMHSGTTDFNKIKNWIDIVYSIGKFDGRLTKEFNAVNLSYFASKFNWSLNLVEYVLSRINKFNSTHLQPERATHEQAQAQAIDAA